MDDKLKLRIKEWKKIYGSIFSTKIGGEIYIYRTLCVSECEEITSALELKNNAKVEDLTLKVILYPKDFDPDNVTVDISSKLSNFILDSSKVFSPDGIKEVIEQAHKIIDEKMNSEFLNWKVALMNIFPGYSLSDLNRMSIQEFFNLLVLGEKLSKQKLINYGQLEQKVDEQKEMQKTQLANVNTDNMTVNKKFYSKRDLEQIAADDATKSLREHYLTNKNKKGL